MKIPAQSTPAPKRRGRPPKAGGPTPKAEVQRAYRARLKTSGKALKLVDADFDPAEQRALFAKQRDELHNALMDVARLEARVGHLERQVRNLEPKAKEAILLRQQLQVRRQKTRLERGEYK